MLLAVSCKAQQTISIETPYETIGHNNFYIKDVNSLYDPFLGMWVWEEGNSYFEVTFEKFEMLNYPPNSTQYRDEIFGKYTYIENGQEIASVSEVLIKPDMVVSLIYQSPTVFNIIINDVSTGAYKVGEFTLLDDNIATMVLRTSEGTKVDYIGSENFSLPTNITLVKQ